MNNSITNESIWGKLSDMDKKLSKIESSQSIDRPSIEPNCQFSSEPILDKLSELEQSLAKPSIKRHHHSIEIASSWVFLSLMGLSLGLLLSLFFHYKQRERISELSDNDLKYRHIRASNKIDSIGIYKLENLFDYNRDEKGIKELRHRIEKYEYELAETAKRLVQAKYKEEEAARLNREAKEEELKIKIKRLSY